MPFAVRNPLLRAALPILLAAAPGCDSSLTSKEGVPDSTFVTIQTAEDAEGGGAQFQIRYNLMNETLRPTDIVADFSTGGAPFLPATSNGGDGVEDLATAGTEPGAAHTFQWNSLTDLGAVDADATFRITPAKGPPASVNLKVVNAPRPTDVTLNTPAAPQSGSSVTLTFFLKNEKSQASDVVAEFRAPPGGGAFTSATRNGGEPTAGLETNNSGSGRQHTFVWDTVADLGKTDNTVEFRIRPAGGLGAAGTATFDVLNTTREVTAAVTSQPADPSAGVVRVGYRLTSATVATVTDMTVEFQVEGGAFAEATGAGCDDGLTDVSASTAGTLHTFRWDSLADLPSNATNVALRLTPEIGPATTTLPFDLQNGAFAEAPEDLVNGQYLFPAPVGESITLNCVIGTRPVGSFEIQPSEDIQLMSFVLDESTCLPLPGSTLLPVTFPFAGVPAVPVNAVVSATTVTLSAPGAITSPVTVGELTGDPDFTFNNFNIGGCTPDFSFMTNALTVDTDRAEDPPVNTLTGTITFIITIKDNPEDDCGYPAASSGISPTVCTSTAVPITGKPG